jgi:signal transduction histidine kinase
MEPADRVVLVDGREQRAELAAALSDGAFEVRTVADVGALDDHLASATVDCVVSTYQVPRRDGLEFLGGLHALETVAERYPDVPRILYTEISNPDIAREAVSLGLFDYIPANTDGSIDRLRTRVREATAKHRAERRIVELSRVNEVIREVLTVLIRADSHETVYEEVTGTLVATRAYEGAWLGRRTGAGLETLAVAGSVGEQDPAVIDADGVTVTAPDDTDTRRKAIVPIDGESRALVLVTDRREAFSETERNVLRELGETIHYSLDAITAHETLEEREAALAAKTERLSAFASVVGHDLRNPLSVASGNLELAKSGDTERLDTVESALDRMAELIDDVLALAHEGGRSIAVERVSLASVAQAAWDTVETHDATFEGPDDAVILADRSQLGRLFENLFRNAVEHGGRSVAVSVETTETGFTVADDGPGLPQDESESLFELGVTNSDSGTGLGLAIVENIADAHDWSVAVGASDSGGARFEITGVEFVDEG